MIQKKIYTVHVFYLSPQSQHLVRLTLIQALWSSLSWQAKKKDTVLCPQEEGLITFPVLPLSQPPALHCEEKSEGEEVAIQNALPKPLLCSLLQLHCTLFNHTDVLRMQTCTVPAIKNNNNNNKLSSFDPIFPSSYHLNIWLLSCYQFVKEWLCIWGLHFCSWYFLV